MNNKAKISFLNLVDSGLSLIERLALEEALLRHDKLHRNWAIIGTHDPIDGFESNNVSRIEFSDKNKKYYKDCAVVLGLGGKPEKLVNLINTQRDNVLLIKRFSGGGTVVIDQNSLLTTFIGRTSLIPSVPPYPRDIMQWSSDAIFKPVFGALNQEVSLNNTKNASIVSETKSKRKTLVVQSKSCGMSDTTSLYLYPTSSSSSNLNSVNAIPAFALRENDYVLGHKKMGGNAQTIIKGGWLHHTSFLWDYADKHMEYLTLPEKRPDYRGDRSHDDFLVKLKSYYGHHSAIKGGSDNYKAMDKHSFFNQVKHATHNAFTLEEVTLLDALQVIESEFGSMQEWYDGKCRTRVLS